jgi:phosphotransferase system HPr-like phosphotransfer protein
MDNSIVAALGGAGTVALAVIAVIFLAIGLGIGYVVFSPPAGAGNDTYVINETALKAQISAFNRISALTGSNITLVYQSAKVDADGLIEVLALDTGTGTTAKVIFSKTNKYISIMETTQEFPIDIVNYSKTVEAALAGSNSTTDTPKTVTKSDKPTVELFVMSYCPYGTQAEKGIIPAAEALKGRINFSVKFVYYAMHGWKEIEENTRQYCIQKEQNDKFVPYLACFLNASNASGCVASSGVDAASLGACMNATDAAYNITGLFNDQANWLSGYYPIYPIDLAENNLYGVGGSPTLVINGAEVSSGRDSASMLASICSAFNIAPSECSASLSSATPSAGFGYSGEGDAGALAQCG